MKKFFAGLAACVMTLFGAFSFTGCDMIDNAIGNALDVEYLEKQVEVLKDENKALKEEVASLKFELTFPNGLVTESCILNNVKVIRDQVNVEGSVYAVRADGAEVEVTINGGYYDAGCGSLYNITVWAHNGSKVVINGGEFVTGADVNGEANHVIYAAGGSTIEINGGIFKSSIEAPMMLNCQDNNGTIIVKGGTFINFNPDDCVSEGEHTSFLAEGYEVQLEEIDGIKYYKVVQIIQVEIPEVEQEQAQTPEEF